MESGILSGEVRAREAAQRLGLLILLWRREFGITQSELARRAGLLQSYISELETGTIDPRLSTVYRILQGFGNVTLVEFIEGPAKARRMLRQEEAKSLNVH